MKRIGFLVAIAGICVVFSGGCAKEETLALKFSPGQAGTYEVTSEAIKDYKFEQPSINQTKVQQTLTRTEVVFDQRIESVDAAGNAKALITIKEVKYLAKNPKGTTVDFDSTKKSEKKDPMEDLIGQSYVVKLSPNGHVEGIEDVLKAREAVKGDSVEQKTAQSLLSDEAIKQRHSMLELPPSKDAAAKVGKTYSRIKSGPAGMLTPRSYEEVYTVKDIKKENGQKIAVVTMEARPSAVRAADMPKEEQKGLGFFEKMFDNKETYTGKLTLDLSTGKVMSYNEKLKSEWVAVEPAEEVKSDKGPDVLTMGFTYTYSVEKIK
jgi:hypothetical protein